MPCTYQVHVEEIQVASNLNTVHHSEHSVFVDVRWEKIQGKKTKN